MKRFPSKTNALSFLKEVGVKFGTIIDVGTHEQTPELRQAFQENRHLLFEPASEFFPRIAVNYSGLNWELIPVAVSDNDGEGTLRKVAITGGEISHSKLEYDAPSGQAYEDGESLGLSTIKTVRLDTLLNRRSEPKPYLLKVDVDGFEIPILRGAEGIWGDIDCIILEITADTFLERVQFVLSRGFRIFDIIDQCYYGGSFSQADLIFISDRLYRGNPHLRPWQTTEFSWDKWIPVANYERYIAD